VGVLRAAAQSTSLAVLCLDTIRVLVALFSLINTLLFLRPVVLPPEVMAKRITHLESQVKRLKKDLRQAVRRAPP
jgi:hypothetical protein